jgi:hypothetical protein
LGFYYGGLGGDFMKLSKLLFLVLAMCISLVMSACGGSGGGGSDGIDGSSVSSGGGSGDLSVSLTDSAGPYKLAIGKI